MNSLEQDLVDARDKPISAARPPLFADGQRVAELALQAYNCPRGGAQGGPRLSGAKDNQASEQREAPPSIRAPIRIGACRAFAHISGVPHECTLVCAAALRLGRVSEWLPAVEQF